MRRRVRLTNQQWNNLDEQSCPTCKQVGVLTKIDQRLLQCSECGVQVLCVVSDPPPRSEESSGQVANCKPEVYIKHLKVSGRIEVTPRVRKNIIITD